MERKQSFDSPEVAAITIMPNRPQQRKRKHLKSRFYKRDHSNRVEFLSMIEPMETPSGEQKKDMQKQLRTNSSEDDNVEELSAIESEEEASLESEESFSEEDYVEELSVIVEKIEQQAESEEKAGHASMRGTKSLASFMYSANYFKWSVTPPTEEEKTEADKVPDYKPEVLGAAKDKDTSIEVWSLLFTDKMLNIIVTATNAEIARRREKDKKISNTSLQEIKAFIGILYIFGLRKETSIKIKTLWSHKTCKTHVYQSIMSEKRFLDILACLKFNDSSTRQQTDFALIHNFWQLFISNCTKYYSPGKNVTIGEHILSFTVKSYPFRVRIPLSGCKPQKEGLRIIMMNDSDTYYMINALLHVGKDDTRRHMSKPSYYVRILSEPIYGSRRNITCNKRFTSVPLVQSMKNKYSLSMVGTIRAKEKEIPLKMKQFTEINDSRFLYADNVTLLSYCPKQNKIILVLSSSSLHKRGDAVVEKEQEIIEFYNSTKGGTDKFDQLCREHSTARKSNRWVMKFFYAMLDQSLTNSYILHNLTKEDNAKLTKSEFLKTLAKQLYIPHIEKRLSGNRQGLTKNLQQLMESVVKGENSES